jgi:hypothetical protein
VLLSDVSFVIVAQVDLGLIYNECVRVLSDYPYFSSL